MFFYPFYILLLHNIIFIIAVLFVAVEIIVIIKNIADVLWNWSYFCCRFRQLLLLFLQLLLILLLQFFLFIVADGICCSFKILSAIGVRNILAFYLD